MKLTKYEHACLILDNGNSRLIIDPGTFTNLPEDLNNVACIVITEEHLDHYNLSNIEKILSQSSNAQIISTVTVASQLKTAGHSCLEIKGSKDLNVGGFSLTLVETDHSIIYASSPCRVLTLKVDDFLYYSSDSFIPISSYVQVLALPTCGPWYKLSESVDFANSIDSKQIIATHNGLYNDIGNKVMNNFISNNIANKDREYIYLAVGQSRSF